MNGSNGNGFGLIISVIIVVLIAVIIVTCLNTSKFQVNPNNLPNPTTWSGGGTSKPYVIKIIDSVPGVPHRSDDPGVYISLINNSRIQASGVDPHTAYTMKYLTDTGNCNGDIPNSDCKLRGNLFTNTQWADFITLTETSSGSGFYYMDIHLSPTSKPGPKKRVMYDHTDYINTLIQMSGESGPSGGIDPNDPYSKIIHDAGKYRCDPGYKDWPYCFPTNQHPDEKTFPTCNSPTGSGCQPISNNYQDGTGCAPGAIPQALGQSGNYYCVKDVSVPGRDGFTNDDLSNIDVFKGRVPAYVGFAITGKHPAIFGLGQDKNGFKYLFALVQSPKGGKDGSYLYPVRTTGSTLGAWGGGGTCFKDMGSSWMWNTSYIANKGQPPNPIIFMDA